MRGCWTGGGCETRVVEPVVAALERRPRLAHEGRDHHDRLLEPVDTLARRRQVDAVPAVLVLVPARPDAQDQPAVADVVDASPPA